LNAELPSIPARGERRSSTDQPNARSAVVDDDRPVSAALTADASASRARFEVFEGSPVGLGQRSRHRAVEAVECFA
jgi:hypothetical protein